MGSQQDKPGAKRFVIRQAVLLVVTIALVIFCTIPLLKAFTGALNPKQLDASLIESQQELVGLQNKLDLTRARVLMGAGDDDTQESLKKQVEDLKRQLEMKELENKHLQNEVAMARVLADMVKSKSTQAPAPAVGAEKMSGKPAETPQAAATPADAATKSDKPTEATRPASKLTQAADTVDKIVTETSQKVDKVVTTGKNVWDLVAKIFGSLGSLFTGTAFAISWLRRKREPPQATVQVASK